MPVKAEELFKAGKVREAEQELTSYLRDHPTDVATRTFLFELLCFSGEFARAEKQLSVLAQGNADRELGAVLYYAALHAEKTRHELFEKQGFPKDPATASSPGTLNGTPFQSLRDADPDIGARLEVFAAGAYLWIPFEHIASLEMDVTDWAGDDEGNAYPSGQKMLLMDEEEIPFLELRSLKFEQPAIQATAD